MQKVGGKFHPQFLVPYFQKNFVGAEIIDFQLLHFMPVFCGEAQKGFGKFVRNLSCFLVCALNDMTVNI